MLIVHGLQSVFDLFINIVLFSKTSISKKKTVEVWGVCSTLCGVF